MIDFCIIEKLESEKYFNIGGSFYSAEIDIVNNTDSVLSFWIMSCSWQESFIFSDNLYLYLEGCDVNIPQLIEIKEGQKVSFMGIVHVPGSIKDLKRSNIKLGFILIKKEEVKDFPDFRKILFYKLEKEDIVWSEPKKLHLFLK